MAVNETKRFRTSIYCIAAWCCLALLMQLSSLTRPIRDLEATGQPTPALWSILAALGIVVWQTTGLIRLQRFNRWFAVALFIWWTVSLVWNFFAIVLPQPISKLPAILVFSLISVFNLLSAWYLSRRRFRKFAVEWVAERDLRAIQKLSEKKIRAEFRS